MQSNTNDTYPDPGKTAYAYASETMEYTGETDAWLSPLDWEQGREIYLLPAHATFSAPPDCPPGVVAVWRGDSWDAVSDLRGMAYYDTETKARHEITRLDDIPDPEWTDIPPADPEDEWTGTGWMLPFAVAKTRKVAVIRAEADAELAAIQSGYSQSEVISWSKQEAGARDLTANPDAMTPDAEFIRSMADNRGIPVAALVDKIMSNLSPYAEVMARVLGNQQRREDLVKIAATPADLDAI